MVWFWSDTPWGTWTSPLIYVHDMPLGPISSITVLGQTIVIVNGRRVAMELLNQRSAAHSSRPNLVFASQMSVL